MHRFVKAHEVALKVCVVGAAHADGIEVVAERERQVERLFVVKTSHGLREVLLARATVAEVAERQHTHHALLVEIELEYRRRLAQEVRDVLAEVNTWWRSISRVSLSCAAGSCVPYCRRRSSEPTTAPTVVRRIAYAAVSATSSEGSLDDLGEQRQRRGDAAHVAGDVRAHLVAALGAVRALQRREIDRRRPGLLVVGRRRRSYAGLRPRARRIREARQNDLRDGGEQRDGRRYGAEEAHGAVRYSSAHPRKFTGTRARLRARRARGRRRAGGATSMPRAYTARAPRRDRPAPGACCRRAGSRRRSRRDRASAPSNCSRASASLPLFLYSSASA